MLKNSPNQKLSRRANATVDAAKKSKVVRKKLPKKMTKAAISNVVDKVNKQSKQ